MHRRIKWHKYIHTWRMNSQPEQPTSSLIISTFSSPQNTDLVLYTKKEEQSLPVNKTPLPSLQSSIQHRMPISVRRPQQKGTDAFVSALPLRNDATEAFNNPWVNKHTQLSPSTIKICSWWAFPSHYFQQHKTIQKKPRMLYNWAGFILSAACRWALSAWRIQKNLI